MSIAMWPRRGTYFVTQPDRRRRRRRDPVADRFIASRQTDSLDGECLQNSLKDRITGHPSQFLTYVPGPIQEKTPDTLNLARHGLQKRNNRTHKTQPTTFTCFIAPNGSHHKRQSRLRSHLARSS